MDFVGNGKNWIHFHLHLVFCFKVFDISILDQILFCKDWMFADSFIFSKSWTTSFEFEIIEISKNIIYTENKYYLWEFQ